MPASANSIIEEVKSSIDIINVISEFVELKQAGKNYKGLCPFHQEKTPSFTVNPERQFFYCFGCGEGGDALNFLMKIDNITFQEALKILARRAGISLPETSGYEQRLMDERERIFGLNNLVAKFYHHLLMKEEVAREAVRYLEDRGFSREDFEKFYLGYAHQGWTTIHDFLTGRGYEVEDLQKAGLIVKGKNGKLYDRFRARIIFPIFNVRGEVLGFGGRIFNNTNKNTPKYLNSPDTPVYQKGENLYGLNWARDEIRKSGEAVIMEGYTDVLTAHRFGVNNTVASLGTALTEEQARLLKRYAAMIYIAYDADIAGGRATLRGLDILKGVGLDVRVIKLPGEVDPDEYIKEYGKVGFDKLKEKALTLMEFKIEKIIGDIDYSTPDGKIKVIKRIIRLLAGLDDNIEREMYLRYVAEGFDIEEGVLKKEVDKILLGKDSKKKDKNYKNRYTKKDNETNPQFNINKLETLVLKIYLEYPEWRSNITPYFKFGIFPQEYRALIELIEENPDLTVDRVIDEIENPILKKQLLSLTVLDSSQLIPEKVFYIINRFNNKIKVNLFETLQKADNLTLSKLNQLMTSFKQLSVNPERREING